MSDGEILLMFDVPKKDVEKARDWVLRHHPEGDILGVEPPAEVIP